MSDPKASGDPVSRAIDDVRVLCEFAYQQGFHEMGYDPVNAIQEEIARYENGRVILALELKSLREKIARMEAEKAAHEQVCNG